jgi:outer membrane protein OmpA-like peptidoglycan-associated protein
MLRSLIPAAALLALAACATETPAPATTTPAAPAAAPAAPAAAPSSDRAYPVFFEAWSAAIDPAAQQGLARVAEIAKSNPRLPILVIGYADPQGTRQANVILSRLRAQVVADELVELGVARSRIRILYRGPTPGFESLESRRVEVRVDDGRR